MTKVLAHQERQKWLPPRDGESEVTSAVPLFEAWEFLAARAVRNRSRRVTCPFPLTLCRRTLA